MPTHGSQTVITRVSPSVAPMVIYYPVGKRWWVKLHEKVGKFHEVLVHHTSEAYPDAYLDAASLRGARNRRWDVIFS